MGVTHLDRCLPVSGRGGIDRGLRTAIGPVEFACARFLGVIGLGLRTATDPVGIALGMTGRGLLTASGLGGSVRDPFLVGEVERSRDHPRRSCERSRVRSLLSSDRSRSRDRSRRARRELREGVETVAVSQAPIVSEALASPSYSVKD